MKFYIENAQMPDLVGTFIEKIGINAFRDGVFKVVDRKYFEYCATTVKYDYMKDEDHLCGFKSI